TGARRERRCDAWHEDRSVENAFFGGDTLPPRARRGTWLPALFIFMEMGKIVAVTVPVPAMPPQITPRRDGEPAAKGNECEARDRVDDVAKALCESDSRQPDDYRDEQCGEDVPTPGQKRRLRRFRFRPAPLPCN